MMSPAKRRKLNSSSEASPIPARNLDFFFRKQTQNSSAGQLRKDEQNAEVATGDSESTDEQLARKLQAQWDQELTISIVAGHASEADGVLESSSLADKGNFQVNKETSLDYECRIASNSKADSEHQVLHERPKSEILSLQSTSSEEDTITANIPFDESPLRFKPANYVAGLQGLWTAEGGNASYALLTRCFVLVNSTQSRIKIVDTLVNLLRVIIEGDPSSLLPTVRTIYYFTTCLKHIYYSIHISYEWF